MVETVPLVELILKLVEFVVWLIDDFAEVLVVVTEWELEVDDVLEVVCEELVAEFDLVEELVVKLDVEIDGVTVLTVVVV